MKKILIILILLISLSSPVYARATDNSINDDEKKTVIEKLSKKDKLKIIYISGGVILVASCIALYPIMKGKK